MYKLFLVGGTVLLITACASTPPPTKTSAAAAASAQSQVVVYAGTKEDDQHLICISSHVMDSHIPQRICMTKAQMAARQKAAQEAMRNMQMQGGEGAGAGACSPKCL